MNRMLFNQLVLPSVLDRSKSMTRRETKEIINYNAIVYGASTQQLWNKRIQKWIIGDCDTYIRDKNTEMIASGEAVYGKGNYSTKDWVDCHRELNTRYKKGDIVYIPEPYRIVDDCIHSYLAKDGKQICFKYSHNCQNCGINLGFKNQNRMPECYAQQFAEITDVRVERLQDISDEDCLKEGVSKRFSEGLKWHQYGMKGNERYGTPIEAFAALIDKVSGKGTWEKNSWTEVYEFKLIEK